MKIKRIVLSVLLLVLVATGCENPLADRVEELEDQLAMYEQQQALIDSLITVLFNQQAIIDSLMVEHQMHIDSVSSELLALIDSLRTMQQEIVDMIINAQDVTGTGDDYVRIGNVQICWGAGQANLHGTTENFPVGFTEPPVIIMNPIADGQKIPSIEEITTTSATFYVNTLELTTFNYQAVGYWL